jgi:hypothetical protein
MVKALNVETARVEVLFPQDLRPDDRVAALLGTAPAQTTSPQIPAGSARQTSAAPQTTAAPQTSAVPQTTAAAPARQPAAAAQLENYPPELDRRLAELSALPAVTEAAALIEQRNAWVALLQYIETWYKEHPEFAVVYDPALVQEKIDYNRGTVTIKIAVSLTPLSGYEKAMAAVKTALEKTGRSGEWGWETWPGSINFFGSGSMRSMYFINCEGILQTTGSTTISTGAGLIGGNTARRYRENNFIPNSHDLTSFGKNVVVRAVLLDENGEVIGRGERNLRFVVAYRETWATGLGSSAPRPKNGITFSPMAIPEWFVFSGVKASDLSNAVTFKIISIDGVALDSKDSDYIRISEGTTNKG